MSTLLIAAQRSNDSPVFRELIPLTKGTTGGQVSWPPFFALSVGSISPIKHRRGFYGFLTTLIAIHG
ncbi:MAG: hypothetical protein ACI9PU_001439 [Ascidiaceihabitans sp.]|jgi:hypothetical protein